MAMTAARSAAMSALHLDRTRPPGCRRGQWSALFLRELAAHNDHLPVYAVTFEGIRVGLVDRRRSPRRTQIARPADSTETALSDQTRCERVAHCAASRAAPARG